MNTENTTTQRWFDVLYRTKQYGSWLPVRVPIPISLDPEKSRIEYVKEYLDQEKIEYAVNQVKFGKLKTSKKPQNECTDRN